MNSYDINYSSLPFEDQLRIFRYEEVKKQIDLQKTNSILEIGCGDTPFYSHINFDKKYVFCEPLEMYFNGLKAAYSEHSNVEIVFGLIEESILTLKDIAPTFDVVIIGGFLHEIDNPDVVLKAVKVFCHSNTKVISFVPNANSFHRLLGIESIKTSSVFEFSQNDVRFGRKVVYDKHSFGALFISNGYKIDEIYSYFIKIFPHEQMIEMLNIKGLPENLLQGFNGMIKYMPELGCELFITAKFEDNELA